MLDRAAIVSDAFISHIQNGNFPSPLSNTSPKEARLTKKVALSLFDSQIKSRLLDIIARQLKEHGQSFYTIGSSGHEGNAVMGAVFKHTDMAFLHYRSGAFFIQRAKQLTNVDGVNDVLLSLVASSEDPISCGRHKVFGSVDLTIPPQTSTIASHLPKSLGAAMSITRAKELNIDANLKKDSLIYCSFGDASLNHASTQTTLNACQWIVQQSYPLPIVFVCEDNGIGISVPTPSDWVQTVIEDRVGIHYIQCDGLNIADTYHAACRAEHVARVLKKPVFLHMKCVRLLGHAGSDIESQYSTDSEINAREENDPLLHTARILIESGWMSQQEIIELYQTNDALIQAKALDVVKKPRLDNANDIMQSLTPRKKNPIAYLPMTETTRKKIFGSTYRQLSQKRNLCQHINFALTDLMGQYPNIVVFGEDVGKKGGVYRVTADLQKRFSQRRVFDTLLDETTILGTAIGMAHNGFLPIPEIQFLAYLHNAEDQLRGEAATLSFFSDGQYQNPMVVRIASLAYQKGFGGHYHNDNSISVLRDLPGVIVACPSNGPDAARMLRTCVKKAQLEGRVVVFLEPIALYMAKDLHDSGDNQWLFEYPCANEAIEVGEVGKSGQGEHVILSYANGYYLSLQAQKILKEQHNIETKVIDLRWLSPLPEQAILREVQNTKSILIVDEGRKSGSVSEALITLLVENQISCPIIARITGDDCFIPLGTSWKHVLPSRDKIIEQILKMQLEETNRGRFSIS
jgi:2-oxoisovalerate dehydrogenase E1 component